MIDECKGLKPNFVIDGKYNEYNIDEKAPAIYDEKVKKVLMFSK